MKLRRVVGVERSAVVDLDAMIDDGANPFVSSRKAGIEAIAAYEGDRQDALKSTFTLDRCIILNIE